MDFLTTVVGKIKQWHQIINKLTSSMLNYSANVH